jgi:hypothetical protein
MTKVNQSYSDILSRFKEACRGLYESVYTDVIVGLYIVAEI